MISFIFVFCFIVVHFLSKYMKFLRMVPRSRLLSVASGISVAYVFVHILPELKEHQENISHFFNQGFSAYMENHVYIFAMIGLVLFYGLERLVKTSKSNGKTEGVFWIHIGSFALYNGLIGYLTIHGVYEGWMERIYYFIALAVHFISNDHSLREFHQQVYDKIGRSILIGSVVIGWLLGTVTKLNEAVIAILFALLAGGVVLNVLKEELPEERESNFLAFSIGVVLYTLLLIIS